VKRYICGAVAAVLLILLCVASGAGAAPRFSDVDRRDPNFPYIMELARAGVLKGREDGTFAPDDPVSRRELMEFLLELIGEGDADPEQAAVEHRLVYVYEETRADKPVTRLEAAQMIARALDLLPLAGESPYADCGDGYVVKLWEKGIWDSGTRFRPGELLTRGELAGLLWRAQRADLSVQAFRYSNYWVEMLEGVPLCRYDAADFAWTEHGVEYTGQDYRVVRGVDVSGFQGEIDWDLVKADGIDFAMIRVGGRFLNSGGLYDDSFFARNVEGALAAGLQVGVYFFSQAITPEEGVEEAEFVLEKLGDYPITMPVVVDWEYLGGSEARTYGVEPEQITAAVAAFCDRVAEAGHTPMMYLNGYCGYIKMDLRQLAHVPIWFAQYSDAPRFAYHFSMWQYTDSGQVDGIPAPVDLNLYFLPAE